MVRKANVHRRQHHACHNVANARVHAALVRLEQEGLVYVVDKHLGQVVCVRVVQRPVEETKVIIIRNPTSPYLFLFATRETNIFNTTVLSSFH